MLTRGVQCSSCACALYFSTECSSVPRIPLILVNASRQFPVGKIDQCLVSGMHPHFQTLRHSHFLSATRLMTCTIFVLLANDHRRCWLTLQDISAGAGDCGALDITFAWCISVSCKISCTVPIDLSPWMAVRFSCFSCVCIYIRAFVPSPAKQLPCVIVITTCISTSTVFRTKLTFFSERNRLSSQSLW